MVVAPIPSRECARLDALHRCHILDTPSEPAFDELARLAAYVCRTPIAVISLVDSTRQWFKSVVGLPYTESPRSIAFCAHTILGTDLFIVEEADADERFDDHPWVVESPSIRFYAGVPLITPDGHAIGSLAVMDVVPRTLTPEQRTGMHTLAKQVMAQFELRNGREAFRMPPVESMAPVACDLDLVERVCVPSGQAARNLQNVMDTIPDFLFTLDCQGRVIIWNRRVAEVTGYAPEELLGKPALDFVPPEEQERTAAAIRQAFTEGYAELDGLLLTKDGRRIPYHWTGASLKDPQGELIGITGMGRDVSEQKRVAERLCHSEARLKEAQRLAQIGDWELDLRTNTLLWSEEIYRIFEIDSSTFQASYEGFLNLVHPDDIELVHRAYSVSIGQRTPYDITHRLLMKDGRIKFVYERCVTHYLPDGTPARSVGTVQDITERKQAEGALRLSQERLQQALQASNTGLWAWNTKSGEVSFSKEWKSQLGYGESELPDSFETWTSRLHPDDRDRAIQYAQRYLDNPIGAFRQDFRLRHKDGSYCWIDSHASFVTEADGRRIRLLGSHTDITERKRTEEALRKSEERFRAAYRIATIGMSTADLNGRIQAVNHTLCAILGYSEQELLTRTFQSLTHPDDLGENLERVHKLLAGDVPSDVIEKRYVRKGGGIVWAQVGLSVIRDAAGNPVHMLAMIQDITERKRAEEALQLAKFTVDRATEAIYWVGSGAELLDVNEAACAMLGYSKEEFRRMTVHDINPHFQADSWPAYWEETRQRGALSFESVHQAKDGRLIPIEVNVSFLSYQGRECHCAFVRDISGRKDAEGRLKFSEERFRLVGEATNDILWDWDLVTREHWWSSNAQEKFGYIPDEEPSVTAWMNRLHPDDRDRVLELVDRALASDARTVTAEYRFRLADGSYGYFYDRGQIVREASGQAIRMIGAMIDVTLSKRAYASLEVAYQRLQSMSRELQAVESNERRRLSRELHDEVGQLLTGLKFDLQATRQALGDPNEATFARARERILRALETTDELFARLRHVVRALRPPVLEELGLKAALEAMVSDVQCRSDLACSVSIDADGLVALTDTTIETGLYRMAQELATNVVRHGQAMTMSVILAMDSRHWILTVQDDGVGFDPNTEPISGMGLRGVRERAEILGGHVDISSIPGAGSTVTVWVPVAGPALENA